MKRRLITIDGPSGAGKTTVSRMLADRLRYKYIDTGALYRGVAFEALAAGVDSDDEQGLENLCNQLTMTFSTTEKGLRLIANGLDITDRIRTSEISMFASAASSISVVRRYLLGLQRDMGKDKNAVFEGRDMGTVVFPDADVKFYLDASCKTRATRRYDELKSKGLQTLEEVERDMKRRDENDSTRDLAPLKPAEDAIIIDSTHLSADQVVNRILHHIEVSGP